MLALEHPHLVSFRPEHSDPIPDAVLVAALVRPRQRCPDADTRLIHRLVSRAAASRVGRIVATVAGGAVTRVVHLPSHHLRGFGPRQCDGTVGTGGKLRLVGWMVGQMEGLVVARALQAWAERIHGVEQGVHHGHHLGHGERRVGQYGTQSIAVHISDGIIERLVHHVSLDDLCFLIVLEANIKVQVGVGVAHHLLSCTTHQQLYNL